MRFKSDNHRKAVFANLFSKDEGRRTKVRSFGSVTNFEVRNSKVKKRKEHFVSMRGDYNQNIRLKDIKAMGSGEACKFCKRKGLDLTSGKCRGCEEEFKSFRKVPKTFSTKEMEDLIYDLENLNMSVDMIVDLSGDMGVSEEGWEKLEEETQKLTEKIGDFAKEGKPERVAKSMKKMIKLWNKFNDDWNISLQVSEDELFANSINNIKRKIGRVTL